MRIGELARRSGASPRSIRYYESVGLLASRRDSRGYREFDDTTIAQIAKIKLLLRVGLDITDIVVMLPREDTSEIVYCTRAQQRIDEQIARIERQQTLLSEARSLLVELQRVGQVTATVRPSTEPVRAVSGNRTAGIR
ncbi:MerR family transcriptional regulator [Actinoallomurus liliacearum]|uniref:MerR family transcriptional regulator n=1 Tax=Actinoallomurus liliacearum TaxID=1080073 RepID=A0ABP8TYX0_9ACTN